MTSRERVIRTLNHRSVDRAPRDVWLSPDLEAEHADDIAELNIRFPSDILHLDTKSPAGKRTKGAANRAGHFTDAWGCAWHLGPRGGAGPLVESPLTDPSQMVEYEPPVELLEPARFAKASRNCEGSSRFVLAWSEARPLDRLLALRGAEAGLAEIATGNKELRGLLAKIHDFFRCEIELWAATDVDGVVFGDPLGSLDGLRIPPRVFRQWFKPLYREYCEALHAKDKFAFFQSEGQLGDVFGDLVEIGIDAVHSHLFLMDFEKLAEKYRSRVTFWGEMDQQRLTPPTTRPDIHEAVLQLRRALDYGTGGVIAQCQWGPNTPIRNLAAFFEEWMIALPVNV
jgi:uroporphyrinogen decarboxylase